MERRMIRLDEVVVDPAVQIRCKGLKEDTIQRYRDSWESLPPPLVYDTPNGHVLTDGFHRFEAARRLGLVEIEFDVRTGTYEDAMSEAVLGNLRHGDSLTREDRNAGIKRHSALGWTQQRIAEAFGVSQPTVYRALHDVIHVNNAESRRPDDDKTILQTLRLDDVIVDEAVSIRHGLNEDTIERYTESWEYLPPPVVYATPHGYILADGFHRFEAARRLGLAEVECKLRYGTLVEAQVEAILAHYLRCVWPDTEAERQELIRDIREAEWTPEDIRARLLIPSTQAERHAYIRKLSEREWTPEDIAAHVRVSLQAVDDALLDAERSPTRLEAS
jgi:ParB-like chromosome segregation protein Spo0J